MAQQIQLCRIRCADETVVAEYRADTHAERYADALAVIRAVVRTEIHADGRAVVRAE